MMPDSAVRVEPPTAQVDHRPWPLPQWPWVMAQRWSDLLFAHWPVPLAQLRPLVPEPLLLETFEGTAWVGVVPFRMSGVRPRLLPPLPGLSTFPELNLRTYVRSPDPADPKPGVYFFSLDAANPAAVLVARALFHLPYFYAHMSCQAEAGRIRYSSRRVPNGLNPGAPAGEFVGVYGPTGPAYRAQPDSLDQWLVERYCLYAAQTSAEGRTRLYRSDIHHVPWPLQPAQASIELNSVAQGLGIALPTSAPLLHFAHQLDVVIWPPRRVEWRRPDTPALQ